MTTVGELEVKVTADTRPLVSKIQQESEQAGSGFGKKFAVGLGAAAAGVGVAAAGLGAIVAKQSIEAASNLQETQSKINQVFGPQGSKVIQDWAATASTAFGQSSQQAMDAASQFAIFGKAAGLSGTELTGFSTDLTVLASDLASFANTSPEEAITALSAALRGESEPIRKYGVLLDDASLKAEYFAQTGKKVTGTLTPQQRVLAAQALIMKQTSDAQGDFARTSDGLANSQRTLTATIEDVKGQIGQGLLPAVTEIVKAIGPILKDVAPMLGQLASTVGTTLADAFKQIQPVLPGLVKAFGEIATAVGGGLVQALAGLVPSLLPVVKVLGDLASKVGPIVGKVLGKVAEVLAKVLDAVMPLLEPLTDLVFTILDAAWPIFEIVADVVLTLVGALKPLLGIVGSLLTPIGELVRMIADALMPILKPLLPLIEAIASVFADVLARAIGLIITAFGYFIQGAAKVYPFLMNNLIKPVTEKFLEFAATLVGAASEAFSWVPGLGDKLATAKSAIDTFKTNATKGISDAAKTIEAEGTRIGKGLVDQGMATMKDPASQRKYYDAGMNLGLGGTAGMAAGYQAGAATVSTAARKVGDVSRKELLAELEQFRVEALAKGDKVGAQTAAGLIQGLNKGQPGAKRAALDLVDGVTTSAKTGLGIQSPSTVFIGIGGYVVQGLQQGIQNAWGALSSFWSSQVSSLISGAKGILGIASPSKVMIEMGGNVAEGFGIGLKAIGKVNQEFLDKFDKAAKASEAKIDRWVTRTKQQLDDAVQAWKDYYDEVFTSITGNVNFADAMRATQDQAKAVQDAQRDLDRERANLAAMQAKDAQSGEKGDYTTQTQAIADAEKRLAEAQAAVKDFEGNLNAQIDQSEFFGTMFSKASDAMLAQFGAESPIWQTLRQNMLQAGPQEGAALAQYIAENGLSPAMQERLLGWNAWAGQVATDQADKNYGQGVQMATDAMAGLSKKIKEERKNLVALGERMGDGIVVGFASKESAFKSAIDGYIAQARKALQINSPSRVFAQIGAYTAEGFNMGVESNLDAFSPVVDVQNPRLYAPGMTAELTQAAAMTDVRVYLGDKELTDLVDVQIARSDERAMDLVIAGRRF